MRYSALILAATAALAEELHTTVLTIGYTNSAGSAVTAVTTYIYDYSNPQTSLLTQTNSDGVITGNAATYIATQPPVETSQPSVVTSQPAVATIPAGLGTGLHTIVLPQASGTGVTSFTISVGSSTTEVLGSSATTTSAVTSGSSGSGSGSSGTGTSTSASTSTSATGNAAAGLAPVSSGMLLLGGFFAALF